MWPKAIVAEKYLVSSQKGQHIAAAITSPESRLLERAKEFHRKDIDVSLQSVQWTTAIHQTYGHS
jgi:hypothetical protein